MGLRCFIAIEVPKDIRSAIEEAISPLRKLGRDVRWVSTANIHLTLKFLGDTPEESIGDIEAALVRAAEGVRAFRAEARGTGAFPSPRRPGVLWVGLECPPSLLELSERLELEMAALGFEPDQRPLSPHLTVGRVRRGANPGKRLMAGFSELCHVSFGTMEVRELALMSSVLSPSGPSYTRLFSAALSGP